MKNSWNDFACYSLTKETLFLGIQNVSGVVLKPTFKLTITPSYFFILDFPAFLRIARSLPGRRAASGISITPHAFFLLPKGFMHEPGCKDIDPVQD